MLKKYFTAGLLLWIPLAVTFWVLETIIRWSDSIVEALPPHLRPDAFIGMHVPGIGLVMAAIAVFVTGILAANFIGQWVLRLWEALLNRIPFVRPLYSGAKQITSTLLSDQTESFKEVVLIEFPNKGQWTYGFTVSTPSEATRATLDMPDLVTVYVPTAPNPTSGYVVMTRRSALHPSHVTVDEALKFHLSLGVMTPSGASKSETEPTKKS
mgnify:FL=1